MIIGDDFRRNSDINGYTFTWICGKTASGGDQFGGSFGLEDKKLNYWCDTDTGIKAKEELKAERRNGKIYFHRVNLTFQITVKKIERFSV